jgi:hypothetical protein
MWRIFVIGLISVTGCSQGSSDHAGWGDKQLEENQVVPKKIKILLHRKAFNFEGVDRISIVGASLDEVRSPIPFAEKEVDEIELEFDPAKHSLDTGEPPDFIHRFKRPDGYFVDFLIKNNRIATLIESTKPYMKGRP